MNTTLMCELPWPCTVYTYSICMYVCIHIQYVLALSCENKDLLLQHWGGLLRALKVLTLQENDEADEAHSWNWLIRGCALIVFFFFLVFAWNDSSCTWAFMCKTNMFVNCKEKEYEEEVLELQPGAAPLLFPLSFPAAIHRFLWYLSHSHSSGTIPIYAIWNPMQFYIILFQICKNHFPTAWPCEIGNHEFIKWLQTIVFKCHYMDFTAATGCLAWKKEKRKNNH